jgi:hypothetical protein
MPLCPQITNTPITVTLTADFTVTDVVPVVAATTEDVAGVVVLVDGKTKAYYQATAPTSGMTEGDIWFDTDDGYKLYYYTGSAWTSVQDTSIAAAQSAATAAQTTADGKNKIYRQGTTPTGTFSVGDLWFNTSNDNSISRWDGSSWVANTLGNNALASISANKITAGTIDASVITVSNINAGNISTGTLAAARIAAGSLDASKITAGTITATQISSSYVYAGTIAAGNITTGTLSATVSLAAVSGTIGGFTLASTYLSGSGGFTLYSNGIIDGGLSNTIFYGYANIGGGPATGERFIVTGNSSFVGQAIFSGNTTSQTHFFSPFATNVTSAANGFWVTSGSGRMTYTTASSQRYKHDIVDLISIPEYDPKKLLNLPVRAFRYNEDYVTPTDDRAEVLIPGFIAEEVDAIYPIACDYSETKGPESWNDRVILPAMLALIQDQETRIQALEGK